MRYGSDEEHRIVVRDLESCIKSLRAELAEAQAKLEVVRLEERLACHSDHPWPCEVRTELQKQLTDARRRADSLSGREACRKATEEQGCDGLGD